MRTALSIAIACFLSATSFQAQAQEKFLVLEPEGSEFVPVPVKVLPAGPESDLALADAKTFCTSEVRQIYSYRQQIWVECLRQKLAPKRRSIVVMSNPDEVGRQYGVVTH